MRKGIFLVVIILAFMLIFIKTFIAEDAVEKDAKVAVRAPQLMGAEASSEADLLSSWQSPSTCSQEWGGNCSEGPPETFKNTYDSCSTGAGGDESINEVYLNTSSMLIGQQIIVKCNVMIWGIMNDPSAGCDWGWQGDGLNIYYRNSPTAAWQRKYTVNQVYSCNNYSVTFVPDSVEGVHQARCIIGYGINPNTECAGGTTYDNDDVNFTVSSQFISITLSNENINFGVVPPGQTVPSIGSPLTVHVEDTTTVPVDIYMQSNYPNFCSETFPVSNMKWSLTGTGNWNSYTMNPALVIANLIHGTNTPIYHQLTVPNGEPENSCAIRMTVTAVQAGTSP